MGADEEGTLAALKALRRELADPKIKEHRGRIVKTIGDGLAHRVCERRRCGALRSRSAARDGGAKCRCAADRRIEFRMGINLGDIIKDGRDIFGDGVNVAARLQGLAEPGGICISRVVRDQIRDKLPYPFEDRGAQSVKKHRAAGSGLCIAPWYSRVAENKDVSRQVEFAASRCTALLDCRPALYEP